MPSMRSSQILSPKPDPLAPDVDEPVVAAKGQQVEILDTSGSFTKVRLPGVPGKPVGWVPSASIDTGPSPLPSIDKAAFAAACIRQSILFGINAHYLAAVAQLRTRIGAGLLDGAVGPFGFIAPEWEALRTNPRFELDFASSDVSDWTAQCSVFAVSARTTEDALVGLLGRGETATELHLAQLIGAPAAAIALRNPAASLRDAFQRSGMPDLPPGSLSADALVARYAPLLAADGGVPATGAVAQRRISHALLQALADTAALMSAAGLTPVADPEAAVPEAGAGNVAKLDLASFRGTQLEMAQLILKAFADAGYGTLQQAAALASAVCESSLDPKRRNQQGEDSVGLFQLNRQGGGVGAGHTVEELQDPARNIVLRRDRSDVRQPGHAAVDQHGT